MSTTEPLNQIRYKSIHWGLLGKWVKYNIRAFFNVFIYLYLFPETRVQVRPFYGFLHAIAH